MREKKLKILIYDGCCETKIEEEATEKKSGRKKWVKKNIIRELFVVVVVVIVDILLHRNCIFNYEWLSKNKEKERERFRVGIGLAVLYKYFVCSNNWHTRKSVSLLEILCLKVEIKKKKNHPNF